MPPKGRASLTDYGNLRSGGRGLVQEEGHGLGTGNSGYKVLGMGGCVGVGGEMMRQPVTTSPALRVCPGWGACEPERGELSTYPCLSDYPLVSANSGL